MIDASCSVTLVRAGDSHIIVDTGARRDSEKIVEALRALGVRPAEVDFVVNTHFHSDHTGGNELFTNARVCAHRLESPPVGSMVMSGPLELLPGVEIVPTPGHTMGSISVFVESDRRYAICGDAIPTLANYAQRVPPFIASDRKLAMKSLEMIIAWADVIVPGHDGPIENQRK